MNFQPEGAKRTAQPRHLTKNIRGMSMLRELEMAQGGDA